MFDRVHRGEVDTWDYQWTYACWRAGTWSALPAHTLVRNLGFGGGEATHTSKGVPAFVRRNPPQDLAQPLVHPIEVVRDEEADRLMRHHVTGLSHVRCLRHALAYALGLR